MKKKIDITNKELDKEIDYLLDYFNHLESDEFLEDRIKELKEKAKFTKLKLLKENK